MIKIEINYDIIIKAEDVSKLDKKLAGVYVLLDELMEPIYVGQSKNMRRRVLDHIGGYTNTRDFHKKLKKVAFIYESDIEKRLTAELYLTRTLQGIKVVNQTYPHEKKGIKVGFRGVKVFGNCQYDTGVRTCSINAHSNGFCHKHGGNGITISSIQEKAVEEYLKTLDQGGNV